MNGIAYHAPEALLPLVRGTHVLLAIAACQIEIGEEVQPLSADKQRVDVAEWLDSCIMAFRPL